MGHDECAASGGALLGEFGDGARGQDPAAGVRGEALGVDREALGATKRRTDAAKLADGKGSRRGR